jgi:hypothetical protein
MNFLAALYITLIATMELFLMDQVFTLLKRKIRDKEGKTMRLIACVLEFQCPFIGKDGACRTGVT